MVHLKRGYSSTSEYTTWRAMIARCYNPKINCFEMYGGAGITVCDRWKRSFSCFLEDMGKKPSSKHMLDRLDNSKGYEPGNVRWASATEQARNKRNSIYVRWDGQMKTLKEWADCLGLNYITLHWRHSQGWEPPKLFRSPVNSRRSKDI